VRVVDEIDLQHDGGPSGAQRSAPSFDRGAGLRARDGMQGEIGRRNPVRVGGGRGEPAADHVDERCEDARTRESRVVAELGHHGKPCSARDAELVVCERQTQIAQQVLLGG
jgi:hypothetical protein